ncbi:LOW QUALITY PROTEIN: hypothetical protein YC2023_117696 [Brassica napus]
MAPYNCFGRHDRSSGRGYFSGSGSRPPYVLEPPHPENLGVMGRIDQSGSGSGQGSQPDGYVRKRFSNGGYRGGRFSNGGDRVMRGRHGDNNQFSGRMHNWRSGNRRERRNSPVFRRSRRRSPVPWNGGDRLSHPHDGFRAEERMMESVRFPFQERFLEDQEIGFMSPPRNRMPPPRFDERRSHDSGTNRNSFRGRRFGLGQRHDTGRSLRRLNSDNNNNFIPFRRQRRFDDVEDSTGGNKFEMTQQQTRRADITEYGGDDVAGSGFAKESQWRKTTTATILVDVEMATEGVTTLEEGLPEEESVDLASANENQGQRKKVGKINAAVMGGNAKKRLVQGLVSPRKKAMAKQASKGVRRVQLLQRRLQ